MPETSGENSTPSCCRMEFIKTAAGGLFYIKHAHMSVLHILSGESSNAGDKADEGQYAAQIEKAKKGHGLQISGRMKVTTTF